MTVAETERLLLATWEPEDWLLLRPLATDPEGMRYLSGGVPWPDERIQSFVVRQIGSWERERFCLWKLIEKSSGRMIGHCGLQRLGATSEIEIAWWLAREAWGQGLATEAARRALQYAWDMLGLKRVVSVAHTENQASIRIMQKLGMRFERETSTTELGQSGPLVSEVFHVIER